MEKTESAFAVAISICLIIFISTGLIWWSSAIQRSSETQTEIFKDVAFKSFASHIASCETLPDVEKLSCIEEKVRNRIDSFIAIDSLSFQRSSYIASGVSAWSSLISALISIIAVILLYKTVTQTGEMLKDSSETVRIAKESSLHTEKNLQLAIEEYQEAKKVRLRNAQCDLSLNFSGPMIDETRYPDFDKFMKGEPTTRDHFVAYVSVRAENRGKNTAQLIAFRLATSRTELLKKNWKSLEATLYTGYCTFLVSGIGRVFPDRTKIPLRTTITDMSTDTILGEVTVEEMRQDGILPKYPKIFGEIIYIDNQGNKRKLAFETSPRHHFPNQPIFKPADIAFLDFHEVL